METIYTCKPSKKLITFDAIVYGTSFVVLAIILGVIKTSLIHSNPNVVTSFDIASSVSNFFNLVLLICLAAVLIKVLKTFLYVKCVKYELTTDVFLTTQGIINLREDNLELYRVKDIASEQNLVYRFLGLGTVVLYTADVSTPIIRISGIENHKELYANIRLCVENKKQNRVFETLN